MILRCAAYLRVSTDKQSDSSPADQRRKCADYADRQGWELLEQRVYADEAMSGVGTDRPGLTRLLQAATQTPRPFDVVLVDDSSRLSRNLADAVRIFERLNFCGIRVVAVSQGIDTESEQADVLMTVHGLVDSLYVKELAKKTHRGLEGRMLRGFHTGGRVFGYDIAETDGGSKLKVNEAEAGRVRRIFQMAAEGYSLKAIAKSLNAEGVPTPRPRAGRKYASWCPTAIREMLRRELYRGRVVWNRSRWVKTPGTNKRVRRERQQSEWRVMERPELRIVSEDLWGKVQARLSFVFERYGNQGRAGLLNRAASSRYLLTGFLKCGACGANLVIVTGRSGKGRHPRYGCPQNFYRGVCSNSLKERQDWLESRLLAELQEAVLKPEAVEYAIQAFEKQLRDALRGLSGELAKMRERKAHLEGELRRLTAAVAEGGHSSFLLDAIADRERELREITERLLSEGPGSVEAHISEIRDFVTRRLADLGGLLAGETVSARSVLAKHVSEVRMMPQEGGGRRYYVAAGEWNLLGEKTLDDGRVRMVAGAGFEPATFGL